MRTIRRSEIDGAGTSFNMAKTHGSRKERRRLEHERRRVLYSLLIAACLILGVLLLAVSVLRTDPEPISGVSDPRIFSAPEPLVNDALIEARASIAGAAARRAAEEDLAEKKAAKEKTAKETEKAVAERAQEPAAEEQSATSEPLASAPPAPPATTQPEASQPGMASPSDVPAPPSTAMTLTVPKMGKSNEPIGEGIDPATLYNGPGHAPQSGYPWVAGSNTYIAGHVLGYAGTGSYLDFAALPNMTYGDTITLTDANGTNYNYTVSEILQVSIYDTWVIDPTGKDQVSLQTCINPPAYDVRLVVRGDLTSVDPA